MVKVCPETYQSECAEKYQQYFDIFPYELSGFQKYAIEGIVEGNHVLVTAHTGSGKTLPAEFAIQYFKEKGKRIIYTSPIKALSNQKYYEFTRKYPDITFGLLTGDIKTNPDADVLIMTTEILMNYLFMQTNKNTDEQKISSLSFQIDLQTELGCVIFDEVHYINDQDRGQVWEKTILMLPEHIQMVMLSATIDNPKGFATWVEERFVPRHPPVYSSEDEEWNSIELVDTGLTVDELLNNPEKLEGIEVPLRSDLVPKKKVYLSSTNHRVVPLTHYGFLTTSEAIFKVVKDKDTQKQIRDNTNKLIDLQCEKGKFNEIGYYTIKKYKELFEKNRVQINRKHVLNQLAMFLRDREMLPAIMFVFSRKNVENFAQEITIPLLEDDSKVPYIVQRECEQVIRKLPNYTEYMQLPEYIQLVKLLEKGIGIHHSGMIPVLREIVELMISKKYIKILFATESFAIGLDCPIKTAVFTGLSKFDGSYERYLLAHEYTQMAGRAGRRGIDTLGYVVHCNNLYTMPSLSDYKLILGGVPQKLVSKYHISYELVLNLIKNGQTKDFQCFSERSMIYDEINKTTKYYQEHIKELELSIKTKEESLKYSRTPIEECYRYLELEQLIKKSVNKKRKEYERELKGLSDQYKFIHHDLISVGVISTLKQQRDKEKDSLKNQQTFIELKTTAICKVLEKEGFIEKIEKDDGWKFTKMGQIASNVAEIHSLIATRLYYYTDCFKTLDVKQLVGIFSCFTDIKVPQGNRCVNPNSKDNSINKIINYLREQCNYYDDIEGEYSLDTKITYSDLLMYDMIDYSMEWCEKESEEECKVFIRDVLSEKSISIGDFTKAMMKIVTISREFENVCETIVDLESIYKLKQVEGLILKYVLTAQSLYV